MNPKAQAVLNYLYKSREKVSGPEQWDDLCVAAGIVRHAQEHSDRSGRFPTAYRLAFVYYYGLHPGAALWHWYGIASADWWPWRGKWSAEKYEQAKRDWMDSDRALFIVPDCKAVVEGLPDVQRQDLAALADHYDAHQASALLPPKKPCSSVLSPGGGAVTRECQFCKTEYGEKCPKCGDIALSSDGTHFWCIGCRHTFLAGEGGRTTGVCVSCSPMLKEEAACAGGAR
jgi:hypothetical protein